MIHPQINKQVVSQRVYTIETPRTLGVCRSISVFLSLWGIASFVMLLQAMVLLDEHIVTTQAWPGTAKLSKLRVPCIARL